MNLEHAIHTITKRGFTDRQALFLILVARHSGVCVMRQYSTFAGIVFGQKTRKFFDKLVRLGFAATYDCAHRSRARLPRASSGDLRGDRRAGQPASPAAWRASHPRTAHAAGRNPAEPGQHLDVVARREGRLLLGARNRERRLPAPDRPARRSTARSALPGSPSDRRPSIRPRRLRLPVCRPAARRVPRLPATARAAPRATPRVDDSHRGSTAPRRRSGQAPQDRVGTARIVAERARIDRAAVVLRPPRWRPGGLSEPADRRRFERCERPSRPTATRFSIVAGERTASVCWRLLRRRSWGKRWSQALERSRPWCCRTPTATWPRWRVSPDSIRGRPIFVAQSDIQRYFAPLKSGRHDSLNRPRHHPAFRPQF